MPTKHILNQLQQENPPLDIVLMVADEYDIIHDFYKTIVLDRLVKFADGGSIVAARKLIYLAGNYQKDAAFIATSFLNRYLLKLTGEV